MKKVLLSLVLLTSMSAIAVAQRGALTEAKSQYDSYYTMNQLKQTEAANKALVEAKKLIDEVVVHEKTMAEPEAFLYKSLIYAALANDSTLAVSNPNAIDEAITALENAKKLNPGAKREVAKEELESASNNIYIASYNKGINNFNEEDYKVALKYFAIASDINPKDTLLYLNKGVSAERIKDTTTAIASYQKLVDLHYNDEVIYSVLANLYFAKKNEEKGLEVLKVGTERFPNSKDLKITELNYYLRQGRASEVIDKLEAAAQADPGNKSLWFSLGVAYENIDKMDKAEDTYAKALEIDPDYFEANINMGIIKIDSANKVVKAANEIPISKAKEYNAKIAEYKDALRVALAYLERAYAQNQSDPNLKSTLREVYIKLGEKEKAAALK